MPDNFEEKKSHPYPVWVYKPWNKLPTAIACHVLIFIIVSETCISSRKFDWNWTNLDSIVKHQDKIQIY